MILSRGISVLLLLAASACSAAHAAEVRFDYVTYRGSDQELSRQEFRIDDANVSVSVDRNSAYLYRIEEKRLFLVNYAARSYFEASGNMLANLNTHLVKQKEKLQRLMERDLADEKGRIRATLEQAVAQLDNVMANAEAARVKVSTRTEAEALGQREVINGYRCENYLIRVGAGTGRACYTELRTFGQLEAAFRQALSAADAIEQMSGVRSPMTAVDGHFPVMTAFGLEGHAVMSARLENVRIEDKIDEPLGIPSGFTEQRLEVASGKSRDLATH